jgi:hypothetical protein
MSDQQTVEQEVREVTERRYGCEPGEGILRLARAIDRLSTRLDAELARLAGGSVPVTPDNCNPSETPNSSLRFGQRVRHKKWGVGCFHRMWQNNSHECYVLFEDSPALRSGGCVGVSVYDLTPLPDEANELRAKLAELKKLWAERPTIDQLWVNVSKIDAILTDTAPAPAPCCDCKAKLERVVQAGRELIASVNRLGIVFPTIDFQQARERLQRIHKELTAPAPVDAKPAGEGE